MAKVNIGIYSSKKFSEDIFNESYIPFENFTDIGDLNNIKENLNILVYALSENEFCFDNLMEIPDFIENNQYFDILFYIPDVINDNQNVDLLEENIKIRKKIILYLKQYKKNIFVTNNKEELIDNLHAYYRSNKIGKMMGFNSLHNIG